MISEIIGRTLDNGFNVSLAIKDTLGFRRNTKNLTKNIEKYKSLIEGKFGLLIEEFDIFGEYGLSVYVLLQDKTIYYSVFENSLSSNKNVYKTITVINNGTEKDFYFANTIVDHIYKIQEGKAILIDKNNPSFVNMIGNAFSEELENKYIGLDKVKEEIINEISESLRTQK